MNPPLDTLLDAPAGKTLEFKRDLSSARPLLRTLVAFANTAGGKLILGIGDDRRIHGIDQPLDEEERLCSMIADAIEPRLVPNIELVTLEGRTLLVVEEFLSGQRPHWLKADGPEAGVFVRLGSTNRQADRERIAELRRSVEGPGFDEQPMPDLSVDDLDLDAARRLFGAARPPDESKLLTLRLLCRQQGRLVPTRGAILLFGRERLAHFPDAWVQCGRFLGTEKIDIFDHAEIDGPLPGMVDEIMLFLKKHAYRGADLSEVRRKDVWSIPLTILREVVINALVHTDYSQRGAPIRIVFLDDRIEVENPGILLPGLTLEDIRQGTSKIRNGVIAHVFRELSLIEQWGTGIARIFAEAARLGLPEPEIAESGMRMRVVVRLPAAVAAGKAAARHPGEQVGEQVAVVLRACSGEPQTHRALLSALGLSPVYLNHRRHIAPLLEAGLLEMTLPDKPNSRLQRYRLTRTGRAALERLSAPDHGDEPGR